MAEFSFKNIFWQVSALRPIPLKRRRNWWMIW